MRSYPRIVIGVALACGLSVLFRAVALERTLPFWAVASLLELTGILVAACLWFAVRGLRPVAEPAGLGERAYAVLASSFVWTPALVVGAFYLGHRFLGEGSGAPDWIKDTCFYALAAASPIVHFTAFALILQTPRGSRWVFAALNGLMFLIDLLFLGVASNLLQLGMG